MPDPAGGTEPRKGPWRLATTVTSSAAELVDGTYVDRDVSVTANAYDNAAGTLTDAGWLYATPTTVTVKDVTVGKDLVTVTGIDERGRIVQSRQPKSPGTDPGTTITKYYTGDDSAVGTLCDDRPEWAGLLCKVDPAAQPSGAQLPSRSYTYTRDLAVELVSETSAAMKRTTTTSYDGGGRVTKVKTVLTNAPAGDLVLPETTTSYWPETGLTKTVTSGGASATTSYDTLGRVTSQTDGAGNTATTSYDAAGRVSASNDGKAATSYTYNGTDAAGNTEYRGLLTAKTVTGLVGASTPFKAAYDPDGSLILEVHPNGMTTNTISDPAGHDLDQTWTAADGTLLSESSRVWGSDGNVTTDSGLGRTSDYQYDGADRLTRSKTTLDAAGTCTIRAYTFDDDSNRTNLETWTGTAGTCPDTATTPTSTAPRTYNKADRATLTGYEYDDLGRTRTLPAADSPTANQVGFTYYSNDLVASMTTATTTRAYGLDALGRIASWTDTTAGTPGPTSRNHYDDNSDNPAWTDNGDNTWTRPITAISGNLAATVTGNTGGPTHTTAQIGDLHGDIIATIDNTTNANTLTSASAYTEYGTQADGTTQPRYGWLGTKQRQTETFTAPGGNAGPYLYPTNPITGYDLDGKISWRTFLKRTATVTGVVAFAVCVAKSLSAQLPETLFLMGRRDMRYRCGI